MRVESFGMYLGQNYHSLMRLLGAYLSFSIALRVDPLVHAFATVLKRENLTQMPTINWRAHLRLMFSTGKVYLNEPK